MKKNFSTFAKAIFLLLFVFTIISCNLPASLSSPKQETQEEKSSSSTISNTQKTDKNGQVRFSQSDNQPSIVVQVVNEANQKPLPGIDVSILTSGVKMLAIATDNSGKYLPSAKEITSASSEVGKSTKKLAASAKQVEELSAIIVLAEVVSIVQNVQQWQKFLSEVPDIKLFESGEQDFCINPLQKKDAESALLGSAFILMPPVEGITSAFSSDVVLKGISLVLDENLQEAVENKISAKLEHSTPMIVRWRIHKLSDSNLSFLEPVGYCLEPLDRTNARSAISWVEYGIAQKDLYVFDTLGADNIYYAFYIEGTEPVEKKFFLEELSQRLASQPQCAGIMQLEETTWLVWYKNWSPAWEMDESCYSDCQKLDPPQTSSINAFYISKDNGQYTLDTNFVNSPKIFYDAYNLSMQSCDVLQTNISSKSSTSSINNVTSTGGSCPNAPTQRLTVGKSANVCTRTDAVKLRKSPDRSATVIERIVTGTEVKVIGGPKCANNWSWWQVQLEDATTGWLAEGGDETDPYFLCP